MACDVGCALERRAYGPSFLLLLLLLLLLRFSLYLVITLLA